MWLGCARSHRYIVEGDPGIAVYAEIWSIASCLRPRFPSGSADKRSERTRPAIIAHVLSIRTGSMIRFAPDAAWVEMSPLLRSEQAPVQLPVGCLNSAPTH